ncbi:uncharacterized protein BX664DRAFT_340308 [Halteromyces radiatus]|uniref:uncharacterized protein n=1 Tax=Halteromyces radiatus TaxID=101107 RepID=UPI00221E64E0|nr:uncharacterized protein BX664DRAFT_340308 [Halteromyces radiatus]KAI8081397.1 hypothetical protein BX664DRAFT_340308 [Halteromyces radiatus]
MAEHEIISNFSLFYEIMLERKDMFLFFFFFFILYHHHHIEINMISQSTFYIFFCYSFFFIYYDLVLMIENDFANNIYNNQRLF